ncbi:hypothetical protein MO867_14085 [Microbulbifer sp. OS29]|uniref:Uncharacterized protein n=1 Tax=Microbulbifer okhotskensis TaxID=2926617 RepID=A0A9X2ENG9_9GAMM|nr:hypothetical protein [Microbulbifer okhotskensis]MCO1335464.1 hypothetical protein [Microbulbifer okhotskensis]
MAYQTGIVNSAVDLLTVIQGFAQNNGWTLNGSVLQKSDAYIKLTANSDDELQITGLRDGLSSDPDACPRYSRIAFDTGLWPTNAAYHIAAFSNPDTLWVTMVSGVTDHWHLGFGTLEKLGNWTGGQWFHAQHSSSNAGNNCYSTVLGGTYSMWGGDTARECALFWSQKDGRSWDSQSHISKCSYLHCELRGYVWESTYSANDKSDLNAVHGPTIFRPIHCSNPNKFNGQTILTPFNLFLQNTDGHYMSIGHVGHLRFVKLTNYNPADILTVGSERWKVFPWHRKDSAVPNGKEPNYNDGSFSTGVLGIAVRYDGP